ncbi:MAG: transglycosylase domain-containing protein [bacterium]|nr:transglycosylase domain-containing protein [bacterium]
MKLFLSKRKKFNVFSVFLRFLAVFIGAVFLFFLAVFFYYIKDFPKPEKFTEKSFIESTKIYDRTGTVLLYNLYGEEKRTVIPIEKMPLYLRQAVIVTEDANFYKHKGVDLWALTKVILESVKEGRIIRGASTVSQQLIRNSFLTREKTFERKIKELVLTLELERRYPKEKILEFYLNQIPLGGDLYGVEAASQGYFHKKAEELSLVESVILASIIQAPTYYSPNGPNKQELLKRKDWVLQRMNLYGYINKEDFEKAKNEELKFYLPTTDMKAPHFVMYIINDYLISKFGEEFLKQNGLKVYTSLDWRLQENAEIIVSEKSSIYEEFGAYNAALVSINPKNGQILAMVGSKDYWSESYPENCVSGANCLFEPQDNVVLRKRQPGSAFKPFVYAAAFEKGFTPDTIIFDVPTNFGIWGTKTYAPQNYDGKFRGPLTMKQALAQSLNVPSVKVLYLAGVQNSINTAQKMGITTLTQPASFYGLSLVLGGGEVKLIEITSAYGVFSQDGLRAPITPILKIEDSEGNILEKNENQELKRVLSSQIARTINNILSDNKARSPIFGANSNLYFEKYETAAKTGTTQNYKDEWAIGYSDSLVTGAWVGNNNNSPMASKLAVLTAGAIWHSFMDKAFQYYTPRNFQKPNPITANKSALNGIIEKPYHSILYYIDKNNPRSEKPANPSNDPQYLLWEQGIYNYYSKP